MAEPATTRSRPKNFSQRKKNNGRAATGIDHNVRARIAHLADKSENDLKQVAADYASCPSDCANGRTSSEQWDSVLNRSRATVVCSAQTVRCNVRRSKTSRPRIQRYTKTGVFVCVRTLFVTLPSTTADSPPRPCDAMTMRSQPLSEAAAIMA